MAKYFDITTPVTTLALGGTRAGEVMFTIGNATAGAIQGEAIVAPGAGAAAAWFGVDRPVRAYPVKHTEQALVSIAVPKEAPAGTYTFKLRAQLVGGVPEEDFDDGPEVTFQVPPVPQEPPPPPRKFPWWILAVIAAVVALIVIGAIVFVVTRPGPSPSPSPSPSPTPTPVPTPEQLPDLVVLGARDQRPNLLVFIRNQGEAPAGPFVVLVRDDDVLGGTDEQRQTVRGLAAGAGTDLTFQVTDVLGRSEVTIVVDERDQVRESNEANNTSVERG
jgi:hypothetical protein